MLRYRRVAVLVHCRSAAAGGEGDAGARGDGERLEVTKAVGQVAEAIAVEERRRHGAERLGADAARTGAAEVQVEPHGGDRLVSVALVELVFQARRDVVEAVLRRAVLVGEAQVVDA